MGHVSEEELKEKNKSQKFLFFKSQKLKMVSKGKLKRKTKRVNTKERVKAEKKVREHNRKLRRDKRKNPGKYAKSKKDPGVPNECPFKEKVLQEVEQARHLKQQEKEKRREEAKIKRAEA